MNDLVKLYSYLFNPVNQDEKSKGGFSKRMRISLWKTEGIKEAKFALSYVYGLTGEYVLIQNLSLFLPGKLVHLYHFFLGSTYMC